MAVVLRLVHPAVPQRHGEVEQKAVGLGDPLLGVNAQAREHSGGKEGIAVGKTAQKGKQGGDGLKFDPSGLGGAHPHQKQVAHQQNQPLADVAVQGEIKAPGHVGGSAPAGYVRREQNPAPKAEDVVVQKAHGEAQDAPRRRRPANTSQNQPQENIQDVVPNQIHQHLPGV